MTQRKVELLAFKLEQIISKILTPKVAFTTPLFAHLRAVLTKQKY